jgi:dienelactone hydrolase
MRGTVREAETGIGLVGLFVKAYDKDLLFDDLLGSTYTKEGGRFEIISTPKDFRDLFEVKPDIYFKVFAPDSETLLYSTEKAVRWAAGRIEEFDVLIPRDCLGDLAPTRTVRLFDDHGEERTDLDVGESLTVQVEGLRPETAHDVVLLDESGDELFTNRLMSDREGVIEATTIWPQLGLQDPHTGEQLGVEQAQERWQGRELRLEIRTDEQAVVKQVVRFADSFTRPLLFSTDAEGIVVNGFEAGERDAIVSGHNLPFEGQARVFMVPRQCNWQPGNPFSPVRLASGRSAFADVDINEERRFRVRVARARELEPGAYDFIVRQLRYGYEDDEDLVLRSTDLVTRTISGLVVREEFMASKAVLGGCVNTSTPISGRRIIGPPYFQYADTFQVGENIYAALEPTAIHPSVLGNMVALYVIKHKPWSEWSTNPGLNHLSQLGGNKKVQTFKTQAGCINFNARLVWSSASKVGEYDIVADFGNNKPDAASFKPNDKFNPPHDIIDGYYVAGFRIVPDPTTDTTFAHYGSFEYDESTQGSVTVKDEGGFYDPYELPPYPVKPTFMNFTVPMRAVVYFPADASGTTKPSQISKTKKSYPLVVLVHGNSSKQSSYKGYNYLLTHLAKNGFIAASIYLKTDMGALGRAWVLLKHLDVLKKKFGTTAAKDVGIMGHSRGGEAVVKAAHLNHQQGSGHAIKAIISLAPTDHYGREKLSGSWAAPYLVIYGSMDGDVCGGTVWIDWKKKAPMRTGFSLYDRASGVEKSMVFVYGACHCRFNTEWGDKDLFYSSMGAKDKSKAISANAHQKIVKGYMTAFFRMHLNNESQWGGIFKGEWIPATVKQADGGKVKLYIQHETTTSNKIEVDNFEGVHSQTSWKKSTIKGTVDDGNTLPVDPVEDELHARDDQSPHDTAGLLLRWDQPSDRLRFEIPATQRNVKKYKAVSFRVTQVTGSTINPSGKVQDLYLTLKDTKGKSRSVKASKFGEIPPPHERQIATYTKSAMCTLRIPLHAFTIKVPGVDPVDLKNVESLTFHFKAKSQGEIEIDSVEFTA